MSTKLIATAFLNAETLLTGLSVTIRIWDITDPELPVLIITDDDCVEIGGGGYAYSFATYDKTKNYQWRFDGESGTAGRYKYGWSEADTEKISNVLWDEILTGATHNIPSSSGRRLRDISGPVLITGDSPGILNTAIRIQLDELASSENGAYDPAIINITEGTGRGQSRQIWEYDGVNKLAYINRDWKMIPDATSKYQLIAHSGNTHVNEGVARGGSHNTIKLNVLASSIDNAYRNQVVYLAAGIGADQAERIIHYNGATKIATISRSWGTQPEGNNKTMYSILPTGLFSPEDNVFSVIDTKEPIAQFE